MIGHAFENLAEAVFGYAKSEAFFEHFASLFEDDYLETFAYASYIGRGIVEGQCSLADDQGIVLRKIRAGIQGLIANRECVEEVSGLTFGIEEGNVSVGVS